MSEITNNLSEFELNTSHMMLRFLLQKALARPVGDPAIRARKTHVSLSTFAMSLAHSSMSVMFGPANSFASHMA